MSGPRKSVLANGGRTDGRLELRREELKQRRQPDLLADIVDGRLYDMGKDPLPMAEEAGSELDLGSEGSSSSRPGSTAPWSGALGEARSTKPPQMAPAAQVLGLAVGLLGLDVHEAPSPWSEAWLTFQDATRNCFGLGGLGSEDPEACAVKLPDGGKPTKKRYAEEQAEWQFKVLEHLKNLLSYGKVHVSDDEKLAGPPKDQAHCGQLPPEFQEHLELSEFCLKRITHAVGALQDPAQQDRPMVLREYTDQQVLAVCKDLRQWLVQLGNLFGLYHVEILDLEKERRRLAGDLQAKEGRWREDEERRRTAEHRYSKLEEIRKEERMRQRADFLLGLNISGGDPKIYSQREVDDMMLQWKREHCDPLLADIEDLKAKNEELLGKLGKRGTRGSSGEEEAAAASMKIVHSAVSALVERTEHEEVADLLSRMASAMDGSGGESVQDVLKAILKLQTLNELGTTPGAKAKAEEQFAACAMAVASELGKLEVELKDLPGLEPISGLAGWARETTEALKNHRRGLRWKPAPSWKVAGDLKARLSTVLPPSAGPPAKSEPSAGDAPDGGPLGKCLSAVSTELGKLARALKEVPGGEKLANVLEWGRDTVSTAKASPDNPRWRAAPVWDLDGLGDNVGKKTSDKDLEAMWKARLDAMRSDYEERLRKLMAEVEAERQRAEDALRRLAEEAKRADDIIAQLKKKLIEMQDILRKNGLGKQAENALWESGLAEFLNGRDVFERLYRDALNRMRRLAEAQVQAVQTSGHEFERSLYDLHSPSNGGEVPVPNTSQAVAAAARQGGLLFKGSPQHPNSPTGMTDMSPGGGSMTSRSVSPGLRVQRLGPPRSTETSPTRPLHRDSPAAAEEGRCPAGGAGGFVKIASSCIDHGASSSDLAFQAKGYGLGGRSSSSAELSRRTGDPTSPLSLASAAHLRGEAVLPPLECRGRLVEGHLGGPSSAAAADGCLPRGGLLARGGRSRSPGTGAALPRPPPAQSYSLLPDVEATGLAITGAGGGYDVGAVGRLIASSHGRPPGSSLLLPRSSAGGSKGPRVPAGPAPRNPRLAKGSPGAASMPVIPGGQPRLLVQSMS